MSFVRDPAVPFLAARRPSGEWCDPRSPEFARSFGEFLRGVGAIDEAGLLRSRRAAQKTGERFDAVLTKLGLLSEPDLTAQLARYLGLDVIAPIETPAAPVLEQAITSDFVRHHRTLPLSLRDGKLTLAVVDPFEDDPIRALGYLVGREIEVKMIAPTDLERAIATIYPNAPDRGRTGADSRADEADEGDLQRLRDLASEAPVIRLVNQIIATAVETKASDIHIEPNPDGLLIRTRIDGALRSDQSLPPGMRAAVTSRIKIMAKLDIAERRLPQDGRIKVAVRGVDIDFRVSTTPTMHGESVVMRILDRRNVELDFLKLGFERSLIESLRAVMHRPNGIILVTGPTGSGKTTTLYAALRELNKPEVKIFTVEDPIEYQLAGINQIQVQPTIGLGFAHALRSILRQDPDIIMIGEIRDTETARIAIQAALTGHLVLSTLHTNGAAASIARLVEMGIENYLIASTVTGILAQRLVRRLCPHCAIPNEISRSSVARFLQRPAGDSPADFKRSIGCEQCRGTGFAGRSTIAEFALMDERMRNLVLEASSEGVLEGAAREAGMATLYESGVAKAARGETSLEEVLRVTRMA
ncbi:MAG: GspE/PulE family protein [Roseiarcus sp.]